MNKRILGIVLLVIGLIPLLLAVYLMIQGMTMYLIGMFYPELMRTVLSFIVGIGFMGCLFYGIHLLREAKK